MPAADLGAILAAGDVRVVDELNNAPISAKIAVL
jgi:hypothetical protein